jgi:hypothetical protein
MSRQIALVLGMLAVLIAATVAADRVVAAPSAPTAEFTERIDVDSGTWYCVPLARADETATLTIAAVGDERSRVTVQNIAEGEATFADAGRRELAPRETVELEIPGGELPPGAVVRWRGGPVTVSWEATADDGQRLGSTCTSSPSPRWLVSGANTVVGSNARLYLFNPFETDAVVQVAFATPEGRQDLVSSENLPVPAREIVTVDLNELQPEQPDLGVIVEVDAGRVIATGLQRFGQPDLPEVELEGAELSPDPSEPDGRTVLHAMPSDATSAGFAYAAAGESTASWITIVNPSNRPARLSVAASDQVSGEAVTQELVVGPESSDRIELDGLSSSPNFGVSLTSTNDVGFVAHGFMALTGDDPAVNSFAGVDQADPIGVAATAPAGTAPELALYNQGTAPATASIRVGGTVPDDWFALELGPGEMQLLEFADAGIDDGGAPVVVTADQPLHGTLRLADDDARASGLLTLPLVPANTWLGSSDALVPRRDRTLETRPVDFPAQPDR